MAGLPFICEACVVRANIDRELIDCSSDHHLLGLERMRNIDAARYWSKGTLTATQRHVRKLHNFAETYSIPGFCRNPDISQPPVTPVVPIMWAISEYTLQTSRKTKEPITYNSARALQSSASAYYAWTALLSNPDAVYRDGDGRIRGTSHLSPTDSILATFTNRGMRRRLGTQSKPSIALQHRHIAFNQQFRANQYHGCEDGTWMKYEFAAANLAELFAWGGWLRAQECLSLSEDDIEVCLPDDHERYGLPEGVGVLLLRLLMETKSSADKQADVVLASTFASGLSPLFWLKEVVRQRRLLNLSRGKLFIHQDGSPWTSTYFKMTHLYPALRIQQLNGDAAFKFFDETPGNTLEEKLYSFHTYRRGGRTHVSKKRPGCVRAATAAETAEHGRWRVKFSGGEDMPTHYRESTIEDRIYITLMCM